MAYVFEKYSVGGISTDEVVQTVKDNFEGGIGYEESGVVELVPEQTITLDGDVYMFPSMLSFEVGVTYTVNFDGTLYECVATEAEIGGTAFVYIGNGSLFGLESTTNEPFILYSASSMNASVLMVPEETEIVFSVSGYATVAHKIDSKYIDSVGIMGTGANSNVFNNGLAENASGVFSHAEGMSTVASGAFSHAEGSGTIASGEASHAEGKYNIEDTENKYAHIVGNGSSDTARSNAHTLDWDGNAWFAGTVEGTAIILKSSTSGSTKRFKVTVDDSGTLTATEIT